MFRTVCNVTWLGAKLARVLFSAAVLLATAIFVPAQPQDVTDGQRRVCGGLAKATTDLAANLRAQTRILDADHRFRAAPAGREPDIVKGARERAAATDETLVRAFRMHADAVDDYAYELQRCAR